MGDLTRAFVAGGPLGARICQAVGGALEEDPTGFLDKPAPSPGVDGLPSACWQVHWPACWPVRRHRGQPGHWPTSGAAGWAAGWLPLNDRRILIPA